LAKDKFMVKPEAKKDAKKDEKKDDDKKEEKKDDDKKEEKKDDDKKEEKKDDDKKEEKKEEPKKEEEKKEEEKKDDAKLQLTSEMTSDPICNSAGCTQYNHPKPSKKDKYPMDYPVPNFGRDHDVLTTFNSLEVAEALRQHKWLYEGQGPKKDDPVEYNGNPDLDDDIE
jgi:hypothetical protein